jgi:tetratricopeptide (TPR) repeat protein
MFVFFILSFVSNQYSYSVVEDENVESLFQKADDLFFEGRYEDAIQWYEKVLDIDPTHLDALNSKGISLKELGQYEQAIEWYDKASIIDPNDVNALYNKGLALA